MHKHKTYGEMSFTELERELTWLNKYHSTPARGEEFKALANELFKRLKMVEDKYDDSVWD